MPNRRNRNSVNNGFIVNGGTVQAKTINIDNHRGLNRGLDSESRVSKVDRYHSDAPPTRGVRLAIENKLISDMDLNAFILDFFPEIWKKYISTTMDRVSKVNILIEQADVRRISNALATLPPRMK